MNDMRNTAVDVLRRSLQRTTGNLICALAVEYVAAYCRLDTRLLGMTRSSGGGIAAYMAPPHVHLPLCLSLLHPIYHLPLLLFLFPIDY